MTRRGRETGESRLARALVVVGVLAATLAHGGGVVHAQAEPPLVTTTTVILEVVWFSVGETQSVDVSPAFTGEVAAYTASSSNPAAVSVSVAGSVVSLTAVGPGIAFVEVRAENPAGSASQWIGLVSQGVRAQSDSGEGSADSATEDAEQEDSTESAEQADSTEGAEDQPSGATGEPPPAITLSSRAYCAAERPGDVPGRDADDADPRRDRDEVVRFRVDYAVIGGRGPYTVTSPHASAGATAASGALRIAYANPDSQRGSGYRLDTYDPVRVVVEVSDAAGGTASAELTVELGLGTRVQRHGGNIRSLEPWVAGMEMPENNYVIATPAAQTLVTLVPNVALRFVELTGDGVAHFADAGGGSEVRVNWATGAIVETVVVVTEQTYAHHYDITGPGIVVTAGALWPWEISPAPDAGEADMEPMEP